MRKNIVGQCWGHGSEIKHVCEKNHETSSWHTYIKDGFCVSVLSHWRLMYVKWPWSRIQDEILTASANRNANLTHSWAPTGNRAEQWTRTKEGSDIFFQNKHRIEPGRQFDFRVGKKEKRRRRILILLLFLSVRAAEVTGFCVNQAEIVWGSQSLPKSPKGTFRNVHWKFFKMYCDYDSSNNYSYTCLTNNNIWLNLEFKFKIF